MTYEQEVNIRVNLVLNKFEAVKSIEELDELLNWIKGTQSKIIPATSIKVQP